MHTKNTEMSDEDYARYLLRIGNGTEPYYQNVGKYKIEIPYSILLHSLIYH